MRPRTAGSVAVLCFGGLLWGAVVNFRAAPQEVSGRWWKGNLHTHSLWSDGDQFPEMIFEWYRSKGYHFLALSDHNVLAEGEKWIDASQKPERMEAYRAYLERFGPGGVDRREEEGKVLVRLKTLEEVRSLFEEPGRSLVVQSEEITDRHEEKPVHVNATNVAQRIPPQGGGSVLEVLQRNVDAVLAQRERTGRPMFPHVNHPNFGWAVTPEDLVALRGEKFFEVYNGHPLVHNEGDAEHPSVERMWDLVQAERLRSGRSVLYGLAVDDAHDYGTFASNRSNPGRGWVMVRAPELTAAAIVAAMEAGEFYATTGVALEEVRCGPDGIEIRIRAERGVAYRTEFRGTRAGAEAASIGEVLAKVEGTSPRYRLRGDELYVRAKIVSSKPKENPYRPGEVEVAWTQPLVP
jgi:hypothetical protein